MYKHVQRKVGLTIRHARMRKGYSQEQFAQAANIDRARYGRLERGEINFTLHTLLAVAAHLEITPSELLNEVTAEDCEPWQDDTDPD
ncbi:helix-turn-helix transcriptional regulator [Sphingomonas kyeonggiensis]